MNCPRKVAEYDRGGKPHRHCCSDCRRFSAHNDRCETYQNFIKTYEQKQKIYSEATAAFARMIT
eukprot:9332407-Heterocapsa_arctica.AAC.1